MHYCEHSTWIPIEHLSWKQINLSACFRKHCHVLYSSVRKEKQAQKLIRKWVVLQSAMREKELSNKLSLYRVQSSYGFPSLIYISVQAYSFFFFFPLQAPLPFQSWSILLHCQCKAVPNNREPSWDRKRAAGSCINIIIQLCSHRPLGQTAY